MAVRSWGVQPSEFWGMTVSELVVEGEYHRPRTKADFAGDMTIGDLEEIAEADAELREYLRKIKDGAETTKG